MRSRGFKYPLVALLAAAVYYALTFFMLMQVFGSIPGLATMQHLFGSLAGARIWAHSLHAFALLVSGIPSALLVAYTCRPRAVSVSAVAGLMTAIAGLNPALLNYLAFTSAPFVHAAIDGVKFVAILMLLTWLAGKLPSNYAMPRSSRVVTPLVESASRIQTHRPASGAPTARRR